MERFASRKFLMALGGALIVIGSAVSGSISPGEAVDKLVYIVIGYLAAEGGVDIAGALKSGE